MDTLPQIAVKHLFKPLDDALITLLESLSPGDWNKQTVAKQWKVKDVAAHLLDTNIRTLSIQRDNYFGEAPPAINGYTDLVGWLNTLNADWVKATKRISPQVLTMLLKITGTLTTEYYQSLDPEAEAIFAVDWAGETQSQNWMHLAREYTEKWHHQQQIREAVGSEGIMTADFFFPFIDTFFRALPHTFKDVAAAEGTVIKIVIPGEAGGSWYLHKQKDNWQLVTGANETEIVATISIPAVISWKLFSKSIRPDAIIDEVTLTGDTRLSRQVLEMVSVMA